MPLLVQPHPRVAAFPEDFEVASQLERGVREEIRDRVGPTLAGVKIGLHAISSTSIMDEGPLDFYSDDHLKSII